MNIAIIGAGAMGSLFGGLLAESGQKVTLIDVWPEHVRTMEENGLEIEREGKSRTIRLSATTDPEEVGPVDLALVFVKSTQTAAAAETAKSVIGRDGWVLTLQNGMGNADALGRAVPLSRILAGTTAHGATLLGPGKIRHAGVGPTVIGPWGDGDFEKIPPLADVFSQAGIETRAVRDVRPVIWTKLLVNVGINAITALTGIKNGQLLDLESTRNLSRAAVEEALEVARVQGIDLREDIVGHVLDIARATGPNRSSMGQDVDNRRQTEIGAINGVIVTEALRLGIRAPVNETLTALIETRQAHYEA